MHIRLADTHDLPALLDLYHEVSDAMIGTPYDCSWRRDMHPTDELIAHFVTEGLMLVACEGGMLAAAVGVDHDLGRDYGASGWWTYPTTRSPSYTSSPSGRHFADRDCPASSSAPARASVMHAGW